MAGERNDQAAQQAQNFYNKGQVAYERGNLDIAIDLLIQCITLVPGFSRARKILRAAQIAKFRKEKKSKLALQVQEFSAAMLRAKIATMLKAGKKEQAITECEKLMTMNRLNSKNVDLAVEAADACGFPEAALFTVEAAYENNQDDMQLLRRLADYYMAVGEYAKARDAYVKLSATRPNDQTILKLLKDAEARTTMTEGGWEEAAGEKGGFRKLIRDKEAAAKLDMMAKSVVAGSDAEALIAEAKERLEKEPTTLNFYRALARIYSQNKRFDEAVETLVAAQKVNAADPELDRALSAAKTAAYGEKIAALKAEGKEAEAADMDAEMNQFIFDDLVSRVERYPNDLKLRFELGMQYYKYDYFDEAIGQLQLAQRSPQERVKALYYLAMCFAKKGQGDMAIMQLETANDQLTVMDDMKKMVVFALGDLSEKAGKIDKAFEYYKEVYGADIGFEDIAERFQRVYNLRQGQQG
ncbi:MAG: hypothetical protein J6U40_06025 [Kiritimatiellae bacterium]|nr:hypothetical protein [Kiritimatiellia bacterium]